MAATDSTHDDHAHTHQGTSIDRTELLFATLSGVLLLVGWLSDAATSASGLVPFSCYVGASFFGGFHTAREAARSLWHGRFEIDLLMLVAAAGAAALGQWAEGALLLFLFSLGHALEHLALGRARRAIEALGELAPRHAVVRRDGREAEVPVEELRIGDVMIVKPNEKIAGDGFILAGHGAINQAPVTGESVPVDKEPVVDADAARHRPDKLDAKHRVFAGTINGSGAFEVVVTRQATDTTIARVMRMVAEAESQKSPTQHFADRVQRIYVPAVLSFVVLLLFAWLVRDETFGESFYRAMAVLVAASPCALAISTPSAVLSAVARAGRGGVLVKGGGPLERLGMVTAIAFDKTGTLTEGKPRVTDTAVADGATEEELLRVALAVERLSDHPLAAAVVRHAHDQLGSDHSSIASDLESLTGRGVRATVEGEPVLLGKQQMFAEEAGPPLPDELQTRVKQLEQEGRTTVVVRHGNRYLGALGLMDTPRPAARRVIERLRQLGISRLIMLSGDNQRVADAIAQEVGLDHATGDLLPEGKVEVIREIEQQKPIAMVGDGVNDAPALANATVGIVMGAAGSAAALETADIALMADDLAGLPFTVGLSRQSSRVIRQNLWISMGMVALLIPATLSGLAIGPAVALHEGSTVVVVLNALRLLAYQDAAWQKDEATTT